MENDMKKDAAELRNRNLFFEDWFVRSKPLRFSRGKKFAAAGGNQKMRTFDPSVVKTVIWCGAQ